MGQPKKSWQLFSHIFIMHNFSNKENLILNLISFLSWPSKAEFGFSFKTSLVRDQLQRAFASLILRCRLVGSWRSQTGVPAPPLFLFIFFERDPPKNGKWQSLFFVSVHRINNVSRALTEERKGNFSLSQNQGKVHVKTLQK